MAFQKGHPPYPPYVKKESQEAIVENATEQTPVPEGERDSTSTMLADLGRAFLEMAGDKAGQEKTVARVVEVLSKLSAKDYPALADNADVQRFVEMLALRKAETSDDPPGTVYNRGSLAAHKKPWAWRDLANEKPITFTPSESCMLVWNGLVLSIVAEQETTIPACFYGLYMESRKNTRFAREHAEWLLRKRDLPTHPDMVTPDAVRARATGGIGWYEPGAGPHAGAAPMTAEEEKGGEAA